MKFTFKSEQSCGTTVEVTFDAVMLDDIQDMFKQFLRGSGFIVLDEDDIQISDIADKTEISATADKPWVGLTDEEIFSMAQNDDKRDWSGLVYRHLWMKGYLHGAKAAQAKLKERNNG
jgi:hypothetical protein